MSERWITKADIKEAHEKCSNWGRWGPDDQIGTLNHITPQMIVEAAGLIHKGQVFPMGLPLDENGPQEGDMLKNRWNPIHTMLATGTDAYSGNQDVTGGRYADDAISLPTQCSTQWDALAHCFIDNHMYNGYDCRLVDSGGAKKNGIENTVGKMVGRGVLLDIARFKGVEALEDGYGITSEDLDGCAKAQGVEIRAGDFVIYRSGQLEERLKRGKWAGYAGGDAPGLKFETCYWIKDKDIAAICSDTWGCEVRPNESKDKILQPWHWIVIPSIGISMGEIFQVGELAADCAEDGCYEFFFVAPPLNITGGCGSPITPLAIK